VNGSRWERPGGSARGHHCGDRRGLRGQPTTSLSAPLIWIWDNLNIHLVPELVRFTTENEAGCGRPAARVRT
jgi:hypothetical protein